MWTARDELERFDRLDLTDDERKNILHRNAERLLGLTPAKEKSHDAK